MGWSYGVESQQTHPQRLQAPKVALSQRGLRSILRIFGGLLNACGFLLGALDPFVDVCSLLTFCSESKTQPVTPYYPMSK